MNVTKAETLPHISVLEKIYKLLSKNSISDEELINFIPVASKLCHNLQPFYQECLEFSNLAAYVEQLNIAPHRMAFVKGRGYKFLHLLEAFESVLLKKLNFCLYLDHCKKEDVLLNFENIHAIRDAASFTPNENEVSVYIHHGKPSLENISPVEFLLPIETLVNLRNTFLGQKIDFYTDFNTYDRLYLEAKLESLKMQSDIRLLLAGSSYTMCGLLESQMPLRARNIAVNSQDLYYSIKSIETALEYNPNITHCVLSFAYYLWGCDLSRTSSSHLYTRIIDVNYPVFNDKHHFSGELADAFVGNSPYLKPITPLQKHLFPFAEWEEEKKVQTKEELSEANYFSKERIGGDFIHYDGEKNEQQTRIRTDSHNKFSKYKETIVENYHIFDEFLRKMEERGVKVIVFVPPMTSYYQQNTSEESMSVFYENIKPLQEKYAFTFIDLFDSNAFQDTDFFDYDHLNDQGAKKLGNMIQQILMKES